MSFTHPFPAIRPSISITKSQNRITQVDLRELQWWPVVPTCGDRSMQATYEIDTLELSAVTRMEVTGPARVHSLDCVEIEVQERAIRKDWGVPGKPSLFYARLDEEETKWLAVFQDMDGTKELKTFKDDWFEANWGSGEKRKIRDEGRYVRHPDGTYSTTCRTGIGHGTYSVKIGERTFRCIRVWDTLGLPPSEERELSEAYIDPTGRVVLYRQYRGRRMGFGNTDLAATFPRNARIVIDGCVYVHCNCTGRAHDVLTSTALGVEL